MNKQNIISFKDILNTYKSKINSKKLNSVETESEDLLNKNKSGSYAYLIGKVMGDGHLDRNYQLKFVDKDFINLDGLRKLISIEFNISKNKMSIYSKEAKGKTFVLNLNYALFGRILHCLGAPKGNKTKQYFLVPEWIMNSKDYSRMFLKGLLEDELTTIKIEKKNYSVKPRLKMAKSVELLPNLRIFLNQVKSMIELFNIECSLVSSYATSRKDQKTKELYFHIHRNKENIINFAKNIGFKAHKEKSKKLRECVLVLERTRYNRKPKIDVPKILKLRKEGCSIREISKKICLNKSSVYRIIQKHSNL